jgi:hypothetical protein
MDQSLSPFSVTVIIRHPLMMSIIGTSELIFSVTLFAGQFVDVSKCNKCSGNMKIIAAIEDPKVIKKILTHLGLPTKAPTPWPARGPPEQLYDHHQC